MFEITPTFDENADKPLYLQLYDYIRGEMEAGRIPPNTRLPSIRKLARHLGVSKNTVEAAYQQLMAEGYMISKPKSGYYAAEMEDRPSAAIHSHKKISLFDQRNRHMPAKTDIRIDFRHGNIDRESFPIAVWKKLSNQVMREKEIFSYGEPQGEPEFRLELAKYLYQSRGVVCSPDQIIIGGGIQQLLSLLCLIIGAKRHPIAFENPGYDGAREIFLHHGFPVIPIEVNRQGIHLEKLEKSEARFVYVTPSHQFPLGFIMPVASRIKLIRWAERANGYIIEDDYDSEFRYKGKPIPALQGLDPHGRVIYLGTFSKSLLPSVRIAYMILPKPLMTKYKMNFSIYEQPVSKIHQRTLYLFMREGYWEKHLRKMRHVYQKKHMMLIRTIQTYMGDNVRIIGEDSGLHVILEVKSDDTEEHLIQTAKKAGIRVYPTSNYWMDNPPSPYPQILMGFGGLSENEMIQGIRILSETWFS